MTVVGVLAHAADKEQALNIFARTWQLAWFMMLLLLFRTLRLFAIGLGVPSKYLALAAALASCLPRRHPCTRRPSEAKPPASRVPL